MNRSFYVFDKMGWRSWEIHHEARRPRTRPLIAAKDWSIVGHIPILETMPRNELKTVYV